MKKEKKKKGGEWGELTSNGDDTISSDEIDLNDTTMVCNMVFFLRDFT
jgi:hypothetical protein